MDGWKKSLDMSFWGGTIFAFSNACGQDFRRCLHDLSNCEFGMGLPD